MPIDIEDRLREVARGRYVEDYPEVVERHFGRPSAPAAIGWETGRAAQRRLRAWLDDLASRPERRIGAVTHGLVMTHIHAILTGGSPSLAWWQELAMPDVRVYDL